MADDYISRKQALDFQRAMAQNIASQGQVPEGQMVSGWYVPAAKGHMFTGALNQILGAYLQKDALDKEAELNKQDNAKFNDAMDAITGANADNEVLKQKALAQVPVPKNGGLDRFVENNLDRWNAAPAPEDAVQAQPVEPQAQPLARALAPMQPQTQAPQAPMRPTAQQIEQAVAPAQADPMAQLDTLRAARDAAANDLKFYRTGMNRAKDPEGALAAERKLAGLDGQIRQIENSIAPAAGALGKSFNGAPVNMPAPVAALPASVTTPMVQPAQNPVAAAQPQPAPQPPAAPLQRAVAAAKPSIAPNDFTGVNVSPAEIQAADDERMKVLQRAIQAQRQQGLRDLSSTREGGPLARAIQGDMLKSALVGDNKRYSTDVKADPVNGGFIAITTDNKTGNYSARPLSVGGAGNGKIVGQTTGEDGTQYNRYADGSASPIMVNGQPLKDSTVVDKNNKRESEREEKKAKLATGIANQKAALQGLIEGRGLIEKVGTGRIQSPWNEVKAYFTNSDDYDNMNRMFNQQKLQDAVTWLQGQGSVSDAERRILAEGGFNPKASTESNMAYANKVIGMLQKHIGIAENQFNAQFGNGTAAGVNTGSNSGQWRPSWNK